MSTVIKDRIKERTAWVCDNCRVQTASLRKRCSECGTSRY